MFAQADFDASLDVTCTGESCPVFATRLFRRLRGNSQASLIEGSDGNTYLLKMAGNPQGPNTLANELLGNTLAVAAGLPVPRLTPIMVTKAFITHNPGLVFETPSGSYSPLPGTHLGSCFVGDPTDSSRVLQLLSPSHIGRIVNRECFLGMYLLDIAADTCDHRQALFVREGEILSLRALFIGNGQMFGGPTWKTTESKCIPYYRDQAVYSGLWEDSNVSAWIKKLRLRVPPALFSIVPRIPAVWFSGDINSVRDAMLRRLDQLPELAHRYRLSNLPHISVNRVRMYGSAGIGAPYDVTRAQ